MLLVVIVCACQVVCSTDSPVAYEEQACKEFNSLLHLTLPSGIKGEFPKRISNRCFNNPFSHYGGVTHPGMLKRTNLS